MQRAMVLHHRNTIGLSANANFSLLVLSPVIPAMATILPETPIPQINKVSASASARWRGGVHFLQENSG